MTARTHLIQQGYLYWRDRGRGYTPHLYEAGLFTAAEALRAGSCRREPPDRAIRIDVTHIAELRQIQDAARRTAIAASAQIHAVAAAIAAQETGTP